MFLSRFSVYWEIIKENYRMIIDVFLTRKNNFLSLFGISGLNGIFHCYTHWEIFEKSSFSLFDECKWSLTTEKTDVWSARIFGLESNPLGKSFMYTKKNNGHKIDPWGTPALMGDYLDDWSLSATLWCLFLRNKIFRL